MILPIKPKNNDWLFYGCQQCLARQTHQNHLTVANGKYRKVASSNLSWLVAHFQIFRRLIKGKFDAYALWPLTKKFQNWICSRLVYSSGLYGNLLDVRALVPICCRCVRHDRHWLSMFFIFCHYISILYNRWAKLVNEANNQLLHLGLIGKIMHYSHSW